MATEFANAVIDSVTDQLLTGGTLMTPGRWAMQVRYRVQFIPDEVLPDTTWPVLYLRTHPTIVDSPWQRIDGPTWASATASAWDSSDPTAGWSTHTFNFTVGALDSTMPPTWAGQLATTYQPVEGGSFTALSLNPETLADWPVLISRVRVAKS